MVLSLPSLNSYKLFCENRFFFLIMSYTFQFLDGELTISENLVRVFLKHSNYLTEFEEHRSSLCMCIDVPEKTFQVPASTSEMTEAIGYLCCYYCPYQHSFNLLTFLKQCQILNVCEEFIVFILQRIPPGRNLPLLLSRGNQLVHAIYFSFFETRWKRVTEFLMAHIGGNIVDINPNWSWDLFLSYIHKYGTSRCRFSRMNGWISRSVRSVYCKCRNCSPEEHLFF